MHRFNMGIIGPKASISSAGASGFFSPNLSLAEIGASNWPSVAPLGPDLTLTQYANKVLSVSSQETAPMGITFKPDGTEVYICGNSSDNVIQYTLSTAWDISTGSYTQSFATPASNPRDLAFNDDGTKLYAMNRDTVFQASLTTPYDLSTASDDGLSERNLLPSNAGGFCFASDGSAFFYSEYNARNVRQVNLTTAYDVSTGSSVTNTLAYPSSIGSSAGSEAIAINNDGSKMLLISVASSVACIIDMTTPNDLSTGTANTTDTHTFSNTDPQSITVTGVSIKPTGDVFYVTGSARDNILQYNS